MSTGPGLQEKECTAAPETCFDTAADRPLSRMRVFLLFFFIAAVLYFQTLGCPFLWDEYGLIIGNEGAGAFDWVRLPHLFAQRYFYHPGSFKNDLPLDLPYYRPVTLLVHGLTYRAVGPFFPAYHLESLFLHVGSALLLFSLFSLLLRRSAPCRNSESVALAGAFLFLVHPRNVETVSIIANQTGLLCSFFCLVSLVLWARLLAGARRPFLLYVISLASLLLAMLSKETAYGAPLVHGLLLLLLGRRDRKALLLLSGYFLLPAIPLAARHTFLGGRSILDAFTKQVGRQEAAGGYAAAILGLLFHQLYEWLVPLDTQLFQYPFSVREVTPEQVLLPAAVFLLFAWRLRKQRQVLAFGAGWFFIFYLPSSNLISIGTLAGGDLKAGAHHLYPAHAGLCLLLAASILLPSEEGTSKGGAGGPGRLQWLSVILVVLLLGSQTFRFAEHFRTADRFYPSLLDRQSRSAGAWTNYGWYKLYVDKDPPRSEGILLEGLQATENVRNETVKADLLNNLVVLYLENGRPVEADTMLQCVMDSWVVDPERSLYFWNMVRLRNKVAEDAEGRAGEALGQGGSSPGSPG